MSVVNSIVRAVLFGIAADVLIKGSIISTRYFRRNEGSTDYATIPEVTLAGDQKWEFDVLTTEANTRVFISGSEAGDRWYLGIQNGKLLIGNGTDRIIGADTIGDGIFHSIIWEVSGGIVTAKVDGVIQYSSTLLATLPYSISNLMASESGGTIASGILANLKIYDNGTLVRDYPLNDNSNILANRAASLGQELVVNGDFSDGIAGWSSYNSVSSVSNGVLTVDDSDDAGTNSGVFKSVELIEGVDYVLSYDLISVTTGIFIGLNGASSGAGSWLIANDARTGVREMIFTAANNSNLLVAVGGTGNLELESISIRRADGYGTIINGNADDWGLFDRQANGDWKGNGLAVPPWDSVDQVLVTA